MTRPTRSPPRLSARLLSVGGGVGGLFALLGAWLSITVPRSLPESAAGGGELLMAFGLGLAGLCGLVALLRVLVTLIARLHRQRNAPRLRDPR